MEMEKEKLNSKFIFKLDKEYDNSLEITNIIRKMYYIELTLAREKTA